MALATISWPDLAVGMAAGFALFVFGMEMLTGALRRIAGARMRGLLAGAASSRLRGVASGAAVAATLHSSSMAMVLLVGFVSAGMLTLEQTIPMVLGAEVGTTITAQLIAFPVGRYAGLGLAAGLVLRMAGRSRLLRETGSVVLGLSFVFFAMTLMRESVAPLRTHEPLIDALARAGNPLVGAAAGALATALIQSSGATTAIVMSLAGQGLVGLEASLALVLGANVGTCVTGLIASVGRPREAVRVSAAQWLYNLAWVALVLPVLPWWADVARAISPSLQDVEPALRAAAEAPRQIANAHTLFNVAGMLFFVGLTPLLAWAARRVVPDRGEAAARLAVPAHLDSGLFATPPIALEAARRELVRLGHGVLSMYRRAPEVVTFGDERALDRLARADDEVDALHLEIVRYLGRLAQRDIGEAEAREVTAWLAVANHLEAIADTIETNLVARGRERLERGLVVRRGSMLEMDALYASVKEALETVLRALEGRDADLARKVIGMKPVVGGEGEAVERGLAQRLARDPVGALDAYQLEADVVEHLKRIYYFAKRIAKTLVELASPPAAPDPGRAGAPS